MISITLSLQTLRVRSCWSYFNCYNGDQKDHSPINYLLAVKFSCLGGNSACPMIRRSGDWRADWKCFKNSRRHQVLTRITGGWLPLMTEERSVAASNHRWHERLSVSDRWRHRFIFCQAVSKSVTRRRGKNERFWHFNWPLPSEENTSNCPDWKFLAKKTVTCVPSSLRYVEYSNFVVSGNSRESWARRCVPGCLIQFHPNPITVSCYNWTILLTLAKL